MKKFPENFVWGIGGAAYQIEGGIEAHGREPSIWDTFCLTHATSIKCADRADLSYLLYPTDVQNAADLNMKSYRFSLSWSRVMKWDEYRGKMVPNEEGLAYYENLIKLMKEKNLQPLVTMYHWDLPQALIDNLGGYTKGGWLHESIADRFEEYAKLLFERFGKDVPYWITLNEPWTFLNLGYSAGVHAPGLANNGTWVYKAAKNALLAHAKAAHLYKKMRSEGKVTSEGKIMITLNMDNALPLDPKNPQDVEAASRVFAFQLGWFLTPLMYGHWPKEMIDTVQDRLPKLSPEESAFLMGADDGIMGINHYTTHLCKMQAKSANQTPGWGNDMGVDLAKFPEGAIPGGNDAQGKPLCSWFAGYPKGFRSCFRRIYSMMKEGTKIFITENGFCASVATPEEQKTSEENMLKVLQGTLNEMHDSIFVDHVPIVGYAFWSLMDNYEWGSYQPRFGIMRVDRNTADLRRSSKPAADWYKEVAKNNAL